MKYVRPQPRSWLCRLGLHACDPEQLEPGIARESCPRCGWERVRPIEMAVVPRSPDRQLAHTLLLAQS